MCPRRQTGETWRLLIECRGADGHICRKVATETDLAHIDFYNLFMLKGRLDCAAQDFLYYKKRIEDGAEATAVQIGFQEDIVTMHEYLRSCQKKELRLVVSKQAIVAPVNITPLKRSRLTEHAECENFNDDDDFESISEYKSWMKDQDEDCGESDDDCTTPSTLHYNCTLYSHSSVPHIADVRDEFRDETVTAYTAWLRHRGKLRDLCNSLSI